MMLFQKILWAIDPYDEPARRQIPLRILKYLVEATHSTIQPAYVVSKVRLTGGEATIRNSSQSDLSVDRKVTAQLFKEIYLQNLRPPEVVQAASDHPNQITDALLSYGESIGADLILVNTHGWSGLSKAFRGSFVDRLLLRSAIPVMAVGPETREIRPFDRILYATHLDPRSKEDFREVVEIAANFHAELTVLHLLSRRERDRDGENSTAVGEILPARTHLMRRSRAWSNWASRRGIMTEIVFQDTSVQVAEQIVRIAERHRVGLVCLESRSGPWASVLKGSRVREIVRVARCPVWVLRLSKERAFRDKPHPAKRRAG